MSQGGKDKGGKEGGNVVSALSRLSPNHCLWVFVIQEVCRACFTMLPKVCVWCMCVRSSVSLCVLVCVCVCACVRVLRNELSIGAVIFCYINHDPAAQREQLPLALRRGMWMYSSPRRPCTKGCGQERIRRFAV